MGYCSNVRVMTTPDGFETMQNIIWELEEERNLASNYVLFPEHGADPENMFDHYDAQEDYICFGFDWVKWYDTYKCVNLFMDMLNVANERGVDWQFIRTGEEYGDVEDFSSDNFYESESLPYMGVSMVIDY